MSKIPMLVVALVVGVIMVTTAIMPLVSDYSDAKSFTNDGLWKMAPLENGMEWDYESGAWALNDVEQITGTGSMNTVNAIFGSTWCIRANAWVRATNATFTSTNPAIVVANDSVTFTQGGTSATFDMDGYGVDVAGDYILSDYSKPVYVKGDSPIFATGASNIGTGRGIVHFEGTIDDGVTGAAYPIKNDAYTDFTISNIQIDSTPVDGYNDLYILNGITADVALKDGSNNPISGSVSFSSYVVPYEVSADPSNPDQYKAIVSVLPILAIVGLIAVAAGAMIIKGKR